MMKIYYAGALFSLGERLFNKELSAQLRNLGYMMFLPQENQAGKISDIFKGDVAWIKWCDTLLAIVDNADVDSGTCWEIGYAYAMGKRIVLVRTDFRQLEKWGEEFRPINLMMYECADKVIEYYDNDMKELVNQINGTLLDTVDNHNTCE